MQLKALKDLFIIEYGTSLSLNKLEECDLLTDKNCVNFVSRTSKNNGVCAVVKALDRIKPLPAGLITVAVSGSVMESFVQTDSFYTAFHVMVLTPIQKMSLAEKLFYCVCLRKNRYRYSYGRQANRTIKEIGVPATPPDWINEPLIWNKVDEEEKLSIVVTHNTQ